jgi:hypothetical protein
MVIQGNLFAVLDGATGQGGLDGKLASKTIKEVLESKREDESLLDVVARASRKLAEVAVEKFEEKMQQGGLREEVVAKYLQGIEEKKRAARGRALTAEEKVTCIDPAYSTATCGAIMLIDPHKETAEIFQVGDCMVAVQRENGQVDVLTEDCVARSDFFSYLDYQKAVEELMKRLPPRQLFSISQFYALSKEEQEKMHKEAREMIKSTLRIGRMNANNPNVRKDDPTFDISYPVFNGTPLNLKDHYKNISLKDVKSIVMLSDGLLISQPKISQSMKEAWKLTAKAVFSKGLKGLLGIIQWQEIVDPFARFFRDRLKPDDDKTILKMDLERTVEKIVSFLPPPSIRDISYQSFAVQADQAVEGRGRSR